MASFTPVCTVNHNSPCSEQPMGKLLLGMYTTVSGNSHSSLGMLTSVVCVLLHKEAELRVHKIIFPVSSQPISMTNELFWPTHYLSSLSLSLSLHLCSFSTNYSPIPKEAGCVISSFAIFLERQNESIHSCLLCKSQLTFRVPTYPKKLSNFTR